MTVTDTYNQQGDLLAAEYLGRLVKDGIDRAQLTAAAGASPDLIAFHGRLMANPVFISGSDSALLARHLYGVNELLASLPQRLLGSREAYGQMLGLSEIQLGLIKRTPVTKRRPLARADIYRTTTGFALLELNISSSLGGFECAELNRAMVQHPYLQRFVQERQLSWVDTAECIALSAMAYAEREPSSTTVALVDWYDTYPEFKPRLEVLARLFGRCGLEAFPCHIGQLRDGPGGLTCEGRKVDLVYRFFLLEDVVSQSDAELAEPVLQAAERGAVTLFAPMDSELIGAKAGLGLLSERAHTADFDESERSCMAALVPWTRVLGSRITDPAGEPTDALGYAIAQQRELMLKPVASHAGKGIVAGWNVSAEEWRRCIEGCLDGPFVLQERIHPVPDLVLGEHGIQNLHCNWGVFLVDPETTGTNGFGGCIVRGTPDPEVGVISMAGATLNGCLVSP
jgi:hypothetical protein